MAQKAIREFNAKQLLSLHLNNYGDHGQFVSDKIVAVGPETDLEKLPDSYPWLNKILLVAKPDQLIKRRGKNKLLLLKSTFEEVKKWIEEHREKKITIDNIEDTLTHFIIEPFIPHKPKDEYYVCIRSVREGEEILFYHEGGVEVGDVDAKAEKLFIPVGEKPNINQIINTLLINVPEKRQEKAAEFIQSLTELFIDLHFAYLEINPFVYVSKNIVPLDVAAKLDDTALFECEEKWGKIEFPGSFGKKLTKEEKYIEELDARTGASLKLTLLNPEGRIWTMIAGGGASVIFADTVTDLGFGKELANYGEYSGDPDEAMTFEYARTIMDLATRAPHPEGKVLLIGGGIANFTDVAKTFKGIFRALRLYEKKLKENKVKIYVRRGGPNYREGLEKMKSIGQELGIPIEVYGPETHMTRVVSLAVNDLKTNLN